MPDSLCDFDRFFGFFPRWLIAWIAGLYRIFCQIHKLLGIKACEDAVLAA